MRMYGLTGTAVGWLVGGGDAVQVARCKSKKAGGQQASMKRTGPKQKQARGQAQGRPFVPLDFLSLVFFVQGMSMLQHESARHHDRT